MKKKGLYLSEESEMDLWNNWGSEDDEPDYPDEDEYDFLWDD